MDGRGAAPIAQRVLLVSNNIDKGCQDLCNTFYTENHYPIYFNLWATSCRYHQDGRKKLTVLYHLPNSESPDTNYGHAYDQQVTKRTKPIFFMLFSEHDKLFQVSERPWINSREPISVASLWIFDCLQTSFDTVELHKFISASSTMHATNFQWIFYNRKMNDV